MPQWGSLILSYFFHWTAAENKMLNTKLRGARKQQQQQERRVFCTHSLGSHTISQIGAFGVGFLKWLTFFYEKEQHNLYLCKCITTYSVLL